ncbi:hypothetical protein SOCEGT47_018610 [Sorangium cellulosum]|uniref:Uncharacterized protein n=1 Tax=Sorangium cellulosum TaxID=56 RepID=A0A4P2PX55_SORCE|nr:hypothetical protein [Sorangium cellulosum]AUX21379.1 hypothetical protein SOCEGT47_018610 [Sorangium cellulosum]
MRRKITIALLALGTVVGYASGFASLRCRAEARRDALQRHVASLCVNAARDAERSDRADRAARAAPRSAAPAGPGAPQADTGEGR